MKWISSVGKNNCSSPSQFRYCLTYLPPLRFDQIQQFLRSSQVFICLRVRINCFQIITTCLNLLARDGPPPIRIAAGRQKAEEFIEAIRGERSLLTNLYIRAIIVPNLFRWLALGEKDQVGFDTCASRCKDSSRQTK